MFKKIARLGGMATIAFSIGGGALFASSGAALADPGFNAAQFCQFVSQHFSPTGDTDGFQGQCVSSFNNNDSSAGISYFCKVVLVPNYFFANQGQCVSTLNLYKQEYDG